MKPKTITIVDWKCKEPDCGTTGTRAKDYHMQSCPVCGKLFKVVKEFEIEYNPPKK